MTTTDKPPQSPGAGDTTGVGKRRLGAIDVLAAMGVIALAALLIGRLSLESAFLAPAAAATLLALALLTRSRLPSGPSRSFLALISIGIAVVLVAFVSLLILLLIGLSHRGE